MKNRRLNRKILFILSIVFSITSLAVKINRTNTDFKEVFNIKTKNKETPKIFNSESIKKNKVEIDRGNKARQLLELMNTIDEAIKYIDNTLDKGSFDNVETLTKDCIDGLNVISKTLPNQDMNSKFQESLYILRYDFEDLGRFVKDKNLDKSKEIVKSRILKDYSNLLIYHDY